MSSIIQDHQRELCSEFTFKQTYARYLKDKKRRENWGEAVERMMSTHKAFYLPYMTNELKQDISDIEQAIKDKKILGSQRALQFGGDAILEKHWRIYNCTSSYCDRPRFFSESLWLLLCGSGVGFSIQKQHVSCLPAVIDMNQVLQAKYKTFVIEDSIEGWADALNALVNFFFGLGEEYPQFSYSRIRKNGSALRHGGKAPGPFALKKALQRIEEVFLKRAGKQLKPIDCLDIVCHAADCVRSGGVRRAALLALFSMDDEEMLKSKTNTWFQTDGQRARANISIAVPRHSVTEDQFNAIMESTRQWGEPGFIFTDSLEFCFNPCVEISMCPILVTKDGEVCKEYSLDLLDRSNRSKYEAMGYKFESGWQACNLTEVNASQFKDFEPQTIKEMFTCVRLATKLGTMQAGYTESTYLGDVSKKILEREALLGVSLTGLANSIFFKAHKEQKDLVESTLSDLAKHACLINRTFAPTIGVNAASRITCVKPSGTASLVLGCASGVHLEHAQKYIRRNQVDASSPIVQAYKKALPEAVELSAWSPTKTDEVVSFAIECDSVSLFKEDASAIDFLNLVKMIQTTWVKYGTSRPTSVEKAVHNVSNTTTVKITEWGEVSKYLYENQGTFCGLSFLSATGDYDYIQAPFQRVYELDQINEVYNVAKTQIEREYKEAQRQIKSAYNDERLAKLKEVTSLLEEAGKRIEDKEALEAECEMIDAVYQDFIKHNLEMQKNDLGDAEHDYLESMKSVHADWEAKYSMYTLWQKLHSKRLKFDFDSIIEDHDETEGIQEVACAGGACLI
jgi:ribonucleoside-diphosphate reductase alpha chain